MKTLKDIETSFSFYEAVTISDPNHTGSHCLDKRKATLNKIVHTDILKEEAIKWIKDCKQRNKLVLQNLTQEQFIEEFFNLTDEDLK